MKHITQARKGDWSALDAYLRDIHSQPTLTEESLVETAARAAKGDVSAQELLVRSHLRLVSSIAHQYGGYGLPLADIISEGNIGLIRAAELYDPKFGTKFSTYASVWIKQRIHRAITKMARAVRIPVWRSQRLRKVARMNEELSAQLGRTAFRYPRSMLRSRRAMSQPTPLSRACPTNPRRTHILRSMTANFAKNSSVPCTTLMIASLR